MNCPRCGNELTVDTHRGYPLQMCYNCGYIEGRNEAEESGSVTNFEHLKKLNFNELVAYMSAGLGVDRKALADWLDDYVKIG